MRRAAVLAASLLWAAAAAAEEPLAPCGGCHMAYPAEMLTQSSWTAILSQLPEHFGVRVELPAARQAELGAYLAAHAADGPEATPEDRHYLDPTAPTPPPLRLTETRWWKDRHADLDFAAAGIARPADCRACHRDGFEE